MYKEHLRKKWFCLASQRKILEEVTLTIMLNSEQAFCPWELSEKSHVIHEWEIIHGEALLTGLYSVN